MRFARTLSACLLAMVCGAPSLLAQNTVNGNLFTLTNINAAPNGVWSWFEDERAIVDWKSNPNSPRLLLSSVSAGAAPENGDIDLLWRNLQTGAQGHFELANQLEQDDHNSAALYIRPDGRYLAMYSKHGSDNFTRWRVSTNPNDPTSWGTEQTLNNGVGTTYNNTYFLPGDNNGAGRLYNFTRTVNYDPNVQISSNNGTSWLNAGKLLTEGGGGDRPYVRYASDGKKIFMMTTERHPRNFANSVYAGYVQDGVLYRMDGSVADSNLFNASGVAPSTLTTVFQNGSQFNGNTLTRAWTINVEVDKSGNPVGIISTRVNENNQDHRFLYARFDGMNWQVNEMARAGGFLYAAEDDYTGLASIDPDNPNVVYMSTKVDPRSSTNATTAKYELYKGFTSDFGKTWTWSAITENSTIDNIRPVVPQWNGRETAVTWLRGNYNSYVNWDTEVVGINFADTDPKSLLWRGDASGQTTVWNTASTANWDSGGGLSDNFNVGDEVTFDDSASSTSVSLQSNVTPMAVAFANSTKDYQLSGPGGIAGNGGMRVIGGGNVTLSNGNNTYTGETMVARGTLALTGSAQLSGSSRIHVATGGTLNTTALSAGGQILSNQTLTVDGNVVGNVAASQGSTVQLNSTGTLTGDVSATFGSTVQLSAGTTMTGNVSLSASTVEAFGSMSGNLVAANNSVIQVGGNGMTSSLVYRYLDATSGAGGNTTLANGSTFSPPLNVNNSSNDSNWEQRTTFGSAGNIFESGGDVSENAPELRTRLSGLIAGDQYRVQVNFWDPTSSEEDWNIRAGRLSNPGANQIFSAADATTDVAGARGAGLANSLNYAAGFAPTIFAEGGRAMLVADLGNLTANGSGLLDVFIDDLGNAGNVNRRTWYDGLSIGTYAFSGQTEFVLNGNLTMDNTSTLQFDIGDMTHHDKLVVTGVASFGGTLQLTMASNSSMPSLGDSFDILDFSSASGQFASFNLPTLTQGLFWDASQLYTSGVIQVSAVPEPGTLALLSGTGVVLFQRYRKKLLATKRSQ